MRVLIADDEAVSRRLLQGLLERLGCEVTAVADGAQAWETLQAPAAPSLAVLDWVMPGMHGPELCRRLRARRGARFIYTILVTARSSSADVIAGLEAGADDFVTKPYNGHELHARLRAGERTVQLEGALAARIAELEAARAQVKQLHGLIPICMHCKRIRSGADTWERIESYIAAHSDASFSHALCEPCLEAHHPES